MNRKCVLLSEINQVQKAAYYMISFIRHYGKGKTAEIDNKRLPGFGGESRVWLQRDLRERLGVKQLFGVFMQMLYAFVKIYRPIYQKVSFALINFNVKKKEPMLRA